MLPEKENRFLIYYESTFKSSTTIILLTKGRALKYSSKNFKILNNNDV